MRSASWEGVTTHDHRFGGIEFRVGAATSATCTASGGRTSASTRAIRDMLVETGRAQPHHVLPHTGWVSKQIRSDDDADEVVELFRLAWERARVGEHVDRSAAEE